MTDLFEQEDRRKAFVALREAAGVSAHEFAKAMGYRGRYVYDAQVNREAGKTPICDMEMRMAKIVSDGFISGEIERTSSTGPKRASRKPAAAQEPKARIDGKGITAQAAMLIPAGIIGGACGVAVYWIAQVAKNGGL